MKLPFFIALRYLFSPKSTNAINIISIVSMIGMGLGAFALIVVLSVFNGFESLVLDLQNSFYSDIEITPKTGKVFVPSKELIKQIEENNNVEAYSYTLEENAYLRYQEQSTLAVIKGVGPNFFDVTDVDDYKVAGSNTLKKEDVNFALMGAGIDYALGTNVKIPVDPITISIPKRGRSSAVVAAQLFNTGKVVPGGVFGIQNEFDNKYVFVNLPLLQKILKYNKEVGAIEVKSKEGTDLKHFKNDIQLAIGGDYEVTARYEQDAALYEIMRVERYAVIAILGLILCIISFNIVGSLSMLVMEKKKDIAILRSMGASKGMIQLLFLFEGALGAIIGAITGILLGLILIGIQYYFGVVKLGGNGFVVSAYPVEAHVGDVVLAFVLVASISLLAAWYPSKRASMQDARVSN